MDLEVDYSGQEELLELQQTLGHELHFRWYILQIYDSMGYIKASLNLVAKAPTQVCCKVWSICLSTMPQDRRQRKISLMGNKKLCWQITILGNELSDSCLLRRHKTLESHMNRLLRLKYQWLLVPVDMLWRELEFFDKIYKLVGVHVVTVQLRHNGWVTELQDLESSRQLKRPKGLDNLLYTPNVDFSCFADFALASLEYYYIEGQGSLLQ
ncbi:hypothetical protein CQW23_18810 [Capsicum baccatum]|uniref:Uncharacterized protein n=1 Tax=Capsicum baccatum TaxID=33114 RepID=A0A2G2W3Z7_CAPBA|nr:hypothetical protein CQW23_18810 [Capsicum baccatum]